MSLPLDLTPLDWGESMTVEQALRLWSPCCGEKIHQLLPWLSYSKETTVYPPIYCSMCCRDLFRVESEIAVFTYEAFSPGAKFPLLSWRIV